jgi:Carboxypeptidase regulatory-like domain
VTAKLRKTRFRDGLRIVLMALIAVPLFVSVARADHGGLGLHNSSFESATNRLPDVWVAEILPEGAATTIPAPENCAGVDGDVKRAICVIDGSDTFTPEGGSPISVEPIDGTRMVRLAGPFTSSDESIQPQQQDRYALEQTFFVDPANPVLQLNYNVFLFDYQGYDSLTFTISLTDASGPVITSLTQGGFGSGTDLKTTGWRSTAIDLSGYEGQQVHVRIDSGGTVDDLYGFWAYVDAGVVPTPPVGTPTVVVPPGVGVNTYTDPLSGQTWLTFAAADQGICGPLTINVPIDPGSGSVSEVYLLGTSTGPIAMTDPESDGVWTATGVPCENADLAVQYKLTEGVESETFSVPIGGIALIDPQGVVYERAKYDAAILAGKTPDQARAEAAISGATVTLQRQGSDGIFRKVLSGDPGIAPNVNPEITGADGRFQWDVSDGVYRVVVTKAGFDPVTSREVTIPPPVLDLHVAMGPPGPQPQPPAQLPPPPAAPSPPPAPKPKPKAKVVKKFTVCHNGRTKKVTKKQLQALRKQVAKANKKKKAAKKATIKMGACKKKPAKKR